MSTPFRLAAQDYLDAGWSPIPLPVKQKGPVPGDVTGADGAYVDQGGLDTWLGEGKTAKGETKDGRKYSFAPGNIALRLPRDVIGIDVDAYDERDGAGTLAKAEAAWGPLPATWTSTSRGDGSSGIRLFRVPPGLKWPGNLNAHHGMGVDLIRWDHRYCIVSPSIHDKTGRRYSWFNPAGVLDKEEFPAVDDLPALPKLWVDGLTAGAEWEYRPASDLDDAEAKAWLSDRNGPDRCTVMEGTLAKALTNVRKASDGGGAHDAAMNGAWGLIGDAAAGHGGVESALKKLKKAFVASVGARKGQAKRGNDKAVREWNRAILGAVRKVAAEGEPDTEDMCLLLDEAAAPGELPRPKSAVAQAKRVTKIMLGSEPDSILSLGEALRYGAIPDTYQRRGRMVRCRRIESEDGKMLLVAQPLDVNSLRQELAKHVDVKVSKEVGRGDDKHTEIRDALPNATVCGAALSDLHWDPLPPLRGIVSQPVFRPDGTLLQTPGYDSATGLYFEPDREIPSVDPSPSADSVAAARLWLMETFLRDFPWDGPADLANYVALLMTPVLRSYTGGLSPFGMITASSPGSGKSLLGEEIPSRLFRSSAHAWPRREEERHKIITTAFAEDVAVVVFDNIGDADKLDSPALAKLLTARTWSDRKMGGNDEMLSFVNNRLWMATGNNISLGGDMASRSVLVRLSPIGDPTKRKGFVLGDLLGWLEKDANVNMLLRCLLILALDWIRADAPRIEHQMRNFTIWAEAMGGFLKHHGIPGFMENESALKSADLEADDWATFLRDLKENAKGVALTSRQIYDLYVDALGDAAGDVLIPSTWNGRTPDARALANMLSSKRERPIGGVRLVSQRDSTNKTLWRVLSEEEYAAMKGDRPEPQVPEKGTSPKQAPVTKKPKRTGIAK